MKINYINTIITVKDIQESKKFYETILGQEIDMDLGKNVTFKSGLCLHERNHFEGLIKKDIPNNKYQNSLELYFEATDIKMLEETLEELNIEFIHKLTEQPWKQRVMRFYDLNGFIIEVGEPMEEVIVRLAKEGKTIEEISEDTTLPLDIVSIIVTNAQVPHPGKNICCPPK
jgi:catechol 2,3-dioxygenase-like lactoylglutathione lyase family enzyme